MKRFIAAAALACSSMHPVVTSAAAECSESVTALILHSNGIVYFKTSSTCSAWCQVAWSSVDQTSRAYAMFLAAQAQQKPLLFYWPSIPNCTTANSAYASPDYMTSP